MGKKSRRKGDGKVDRRKAHRERQQERRERVEDCLDNNSGGATGPSLSGTDKQPFFVGDRVWFFDGRSDGDDPDSYRGIVKRVDDDDGTVDILPLFRSEHDGEEGSTWTIPTQKVFADTCDWTLRFDVGEDVLCYTDVGWMPATVSYQWPIYVLDDRPGDDCMVYYKCTLRGFRRTKGKTQNVVSPTDSDETIRKHPSSFRFSEGDTVVFAGKKARKVPKSYLGEERRITDDGWITGRITGVDIFGLRDYYAVYECAITDRNGRTHTCHILNDDDEHVSRAESKPRERLFQAIEQDCSASHIEYLVTSFGIDVSTFRDLFFAEAIKFASYNALLWIQDNLSVDLWAIQDEGGNTILHQIAASPHATRFIQEASRIDFLPYKSKPDSHIELISRVRDTRFLFKRNNEEETWLDRLAMAGNVRALDCVLSPRTGMAWMLAAPCFGGQDLRSLTDAARKSTKPQGIRMVHMIEEFRSFRTLHLQEQRISRLGRIGKKDEETLLDKDEMSVFRGQEADLSARRLVRFCAQWQGHHPSMVVENSKILIVDHVFGLAQSGYEGLFRLLVESNDSILDFRVDSFNREDKNQYVQPELYAKEADATTFDLFGIVRITTMGDSSWHQPSNYLVRNHGDEYIKELRNHLNFCAEAHSWLSHMKAIMERKSEGISLYGYEGMLKYKISLLEDDESLESRLKILEYLVREKHQSPPDPLDAIRFRQCGVLRWMVRESLLDLDVKATMEKRLVKHARLLHFVGGRRIPASLSMGGFLCFAAIEFDDLQSLQWLVEDGGVSVELLTVNGWNVVHASAYFGRSEIIIWLHTQTAWTALIGRLSSRKEWENMYAVHIAVERGHVFAADLLLEFGCPSFDAVDRSPAFYARKSKHEFVQQWGEIKEKPLRLEKDIRKLLGLLPSINGSAKDVKKHILNTRCMYIKTWIDCGFNVFHDPGPRGMTYVGTLLECCKCRDHDFVLWLCNLLSWPENHLSRNVQFDMFWERGDPHTFCLREEYKKVDAESLSDGDATIVGWIARPWAKNIKCCDPTESNPIVLRLAHDLHMEDLSVKLRNKLLRVDKMRQLLHSGEVEVRSQLQRGGNPTEIQDIVETICEVAVKLGREEEREVESYFEYWNAVTLHGYINTEVFLFSTYEDGHPVRKQILFESKSNHDLSKLHRVLAIEDYHELTQWCLLNARPWDSWMEIEMVRIAAFFGHSKTLDILLDNGGGNFKLLSSTADRFEAAMLGAAEGGRATDLAGYMKSCKAASDPVVTIFDKEPVSDSSPEKRHHLLESSLAAVAVSGCLRDVGAPKGSPLDGPIDDGHRAVLKALVEKQGYQVEVLLFAAELVLRRSYDVSYWERFPSLFLFLHKELGLAVWKVKEHIDRMNKDVLDKRYLRSSELKAMQAVSKWLEIVEDFGLDLQSLNRDYHPNKDDELSIVLAQLKNKQLNTWAQFNTIKQGQPLLQIQGAVESGHLCLDARDRGGLLLTHLAAAYDRVDVLEWLVTAKGMILNSVDWQGRTALQVAEASKAPSTMRWIAELQARDVISSFLATHFRRKLGLHRKQRLQGAVTKLQARYRGYSVRWAVRGRLLSRLEESQRYQTIWKRSIDLLPFISTERSSWALIREQHDIRRAGFVDSEHMSETGRMLEQAVSVAMNPEMDNLLVDPPEMEQFLEKEEEKQDPNRLQQEYDDISSSLATCTQIQLASDVVKWLRHGDQKHREFFVRRMKQLASGDRSRILAKRLKGSKSAIFETYLEQKSGHRILWTMGRKNELLVWYIAKHKNVSRLMRLIDDSESRSARQRMSASLLPEFQQGRNTCALSSGGEGSTLLDPLGNVPLKVYEIRSNEVDEIADPSWSPRLQLTDEERDVVEAKGTVLVLGRSGTGKTVCICNRMDYDRQRMAQDPTFSQLFVARSHRLCKYVSDTIGTHTSTTFTTFSQLLQSLEGMLPRLEGGRDLFLPSQRVDFARFRNDVCQGDLSEGLNALIVWTNIRTFIKGSIEAMQNPEHILCREEYVSVEMFGKKRCRLSPEKREAVFTVFLRYRKYTADMNLWDDCDRITALLQRLEKAKSLEPAIYEQARKSKIYVDEIQDYTQAECLLFYYLSGPADLFLAGDPAQSVVEGVEFRFEEIRSVGYFVAGPERRNLIPQKPKVVNVNFRSHSGILNTAAAILRFLFLVFPDSAKQLREDRGLFRGPRPGVFHMVETMQLSALVSEKLNGAVILTHDANVSYWKRCLAGYPLIYGIRAAKGLEFKTVILLDFFAHLTKSTQKPWRNLLLGRGEPDFNTRYPAVEGQLKLLYTAVTRCIEQLFVAETSGSIAGSAFVRWLTTTSVRRGPGFNEEQQHEEALATQNNVDDVEMMVMSRDEWIASGLDNAEMAEIEEGHDLAHSESLLGKAIYCFGQAKDEALASRARIHRSSIRFRSELFLVEQPSQRTGSEDQQDVAQLELRAAQVVEQLLTESLLLEVKEVCRYLLPCLSPYARKQLQDFLMSELPLT